MPSQFSQAAFPSPGVVFSGGASSDKQQGAYEGMTLFQWYVGLAMQGAIASGRVPLHEVPLVAAQVAWQTLEQVVRVEEERVRAPL